MDRRNFLRTMIGGVAAAAAVRTFPFRVYSFPTNITYPEPLPAVTLKQSYFLLKDGSSWRVESVANRLLGVRELDIEETKRIFPGPFHWQDRDIVHYSVLQPDGSVVDADA